MFWLECVRRWAEFVFRVFLLSASGGSKLLLPCEDKDRDGEKEDSTCIHIYIYTYIYIYTCVYT